MRQIHKTQIVSWIALLTMMFGCKQRMEKASDTKAQEVPKVRGEIVVVWTRLLPKDLDYVPACFYVYRGPALKQFTNEHLTAEEMEKRAESLTTRRIDWNSLKNSIEVPLFRALTMSYWLGYSNSRQSTLIAMEFDASKPARELNKSLTAHDLEDFLK